MIAVKPTASQRSSPARARTLDAKRINESSLGCSSVAPSLCCPGTEVTRGP